MATTVVALSFMVLILLGLVGYLLSLLVEAQKDATCTELEARALAVKLADALAANQPTPYLRHRDMAS